MEGREAKLLRGTRRKEPLKFMISSPVFDSSSQCDMYVKRGVYEVVTAMGIPGTYPVIQDRSRALDGAIVLAAVFTQACHDWTKP